MQAYLRMTVWLSALTFAAGQLNPALGQNLTLRGSLNLSPRTACAAAGSLAYAAGINHLTVVDIGDPTRPTVRGQTATNAANITAVDFAGGYVFCAAQANGLVVIDARNPASPHLTAAIALGAAAHGVGAYDTLVAVGTSINVILLGVRSPAAPRVLAQYGRAAAWIDFDGPARRIYAGSSTGAFSLDVQMQISGRDTTFRLALAHQFGGQTLTPVSTAGSFVDVVSNAELLALRSSNLTLAGQYTATAPIRAVAGGANHAFLGLANGAVVYLDQRGTTPAFVAGAGIPAAATGIALTQAGGQQLVVAAHSAGVSVLAYDALAAEERPRAPIPERIAIRAAPNPFNSVVELILAVPRPGVYELVISDVGGRELERATLTLNGTIPQRYDFAGRSAGVYFARLSGSTSAATLKLLYLP